MKCPSYKLDSVFSFRSVTNRPSAYRACAFILCTRRMKRERSPLLFFEQKKARYFKLVTNAFAVRGRLRLKDAGRFRNGSFRQLCERPTYSEPLCVNLLSRIMLYVLSYLKFLNVPKWNHSYLQRTKLLQVEASRLLQAL